MHGECNRIYNLTMAGLERCLRDWEYVLLFQRTTSGGSQLTITPDPGHPMPSSGFHVYLTWHTHIYTLFSQKYLAINFPIWVCVPCWHMALLLYSSEECSVFLSLIWGVPGSVFGHNYVVVWGVRVSTRGPVVLVPVLKVRCCLPEDGSQCRGDT